MLDGASDKFWFPDDPPLPVSGRSAADPPPTRSRSAADPPLRAPTRARSPDVCGTPAAGTEELPP